MTPSTSHPLHEYPSLRPAARWAGRIVSGLAVLFLTLDASMKLAQVPDAVKTSAELGFSASTVFWLGVLQVICLAVYLLPRTAVFGAILWTGYLGGAIATHVRVGNPLFSHVLFPSYVAAFIWGGLWLRHAKLRELLFS